VGTRWPRADSRFFGFVALAALSISGCTRLLGIDGNYALADDQGPASGGSAGGDALVPPFGGFGEAGGAGGANGNGAGGTIETGGVASGGTGAGTGPTGGTGGTPPTLVADAAPSIPEACISGTYEGTIVGKHVSSLIPPPPPPLQPVPVDVKGTVTFTLVPDDGAVNATVTGTMAGGVDLSQFGFGTSPIPFRGDIEAKVDCATGKMTGTLTGFYGPSIGFSGTHNGVFVPNARQAPSTSGAYSGTWSEAETMSSTSKGSGTWDAARTGP
jgi:hypothetical protein